MSEKRSSLIPAWLQPLLWPVIALAALLLFNLLFTAGFAHIEIKDGHLYGSLVDVLKQGGRSNSGAREGAMWRNALIVAEDNSQEYVDQQKRLMGREFSAFRRERSSPRWGTVTSATDPSSARP